MDYDVFSEIPQLTKSKTVYCSLILFSVPDVQLI